MSKKKKKYGLHVLVLMSIIITLTNCFRINPECNKMNKSIIMVNAKQLRDSMMSDSVRDKIMIFIDPYCPPCIMHADSFYSPILSEIDTTMYGVYLITDGLCDSTSFWEFLNSHNINNIGRLFCLCDTSNIYSVFNEMRWNNIVNYLTETIDSIDGLWGVPISFVVDKHNITKTIQIVENGLLYTIPIPIYEYKFQKDHENEN